MAYTVFESTRLASTGRYSARIVDCVAATDIENGTFGYLNGLNEDGGVIYNFVAGTTDGLVAGDIVVADNPAWDVDESKITNQRKDKYIIPAGTVFRARIIEKNDEFAVSIDGITAATQSTVTGTTDFKTNAVYVTIDSATGKLVASGSNADTPIMEGQIMRKRIAGGVVATSANNYGYTRIMYEIKVLTLVTSATE